MKKLLSFLLFTCFVIHCTFSQDKLRYEQVADTLVKQRFIDRYDYVFMTKEPTKWMVKAYGSNYFFIFQPTWQNLITAPYGAIERKISPSFSVQIEGKFDNNPYRSLYDPFAGMYGGTYLNGPKLGLVLTGEARWYYDMAKRIREGKSANNFSGNYINLRVGKQFVNQEFGLQNSPFMNLLTNDNKTYITDYYYSHLDKQISMGYGLQRRFFRFGMIDMSVNLNYQTDNVWKQSINFPDGNNQVIPNQSVDFSRLSANYELFDNRESFFIDTKLQFGLAIADFKKTQKAPLCEVFRCYETEKRMWKMSWPALSLGIRTQNIRHYIGYEQKLFSSPFSINGHIIGKFYHNYNPNTFLYKGGVLDKVGESDYINLNYQITLQTRYYFLQQHRIRSGKEGNNLSGFYVGTNSRFEGIFSRYKLKSQVLPLASDHAFSSYAGTGILVGFQQKIFKNGLIDIFYSFHKNNGKAHEIRNKMPFTDFVIRTGFAF